MINLDIAPLDLGTIEDALGALPEVGGRGLVPLLATRGAVASLASEQEHAAIEA